MSIFSRLRDSLSSSGRAPSGAMPEPDAPAPPPTDDAAVRAACTAAGLSDEQIDIVLGLALPSARLEADPAGVPSVIGASRLGGEPDLPEDVAWPCGADGAPLGFIAQVRLADVPETVRAAGPLPADGILSFFYDAAEQEAWGGDPEDAAASRVIRVEGGVPLRRRPFPSHLEEHGRFPAIPLVVREERSYPHPEHPMLVAEGIRDAQDYAYAGIMGWADTVHRLLGHADEIQSGMRDVAELASSGIGAGEPGAYDTPEGRAALARADRWRLLLQIDSEDAAGMKWADAGRLFWLIPDDALAAERWEEAWLVLEGC